MKKLVLGAAVAFGMVGLAACGGGSGNAKAELVKACMKEEGSSQSECDCMADAAVDQLDSELLGKLVSAAKKGDDSEAAMEAMMGDLSPEQIQQFMGFAMSAGMSCGMGG
ncbi:MAG: hypothetical protein AAGF20_02520 [Pseudomonadota bacterium]